MKLDKYIVGAKFAGEDRLILQKDAMEEAKVDYVVLLIPKSEWVQIRQEMPEVAGIIDDRSKNQPKLP